MSDNRFTHAVKMDANKPPMDLIPWEAMEGVAKVLDFGRTKYQAHNWRKGFIWTRLTSAALRHIFKWLSGEDKDPESNLPHIDHAICCLMFLTAHVTSNLGKDDRAHVLLAETPAPIPAAHVPKIPAIVWGVYELCGSYYLHVLGPYISRDVAEKAMEKRKSCWPRSVYKVDSYQED